MLTGIITMRGANSMRASTASIVASTASCAALIALLAGCQSITYPPVANPPAQADAPRLSFGDRWIYRHTDAYTRLPRGIFTSTITAIDGNSVTVEVRSEAGVLVATDRFTRDWNWLDKPMTNLQRFHYSPPYRAFEFPLAPGAQWSVQMKVVDVTDQKAYDLARVDGRAMDWQRVTVPAGSFDAVRVERAAYSGTGNSQRTQETIREADWYAPAVSNLVVGWYRSEYLDLTRVGDDEPGLVYGDWTLVELLEYRPARKQ
jgi:hypothetical protein